MKKFNPEVEIYDTTLRDGQQAEGMSFSLDDKLKVAIKLNELHIHYIEGGFPASNPKDLEFFKKVKELNLKNSKVTAFSSTRRPNLSINKDTAVNTLLNLDVDYVTIVGKAWDFHVTHILRTSLDENLKMIEETIKYLKKYKKEVIFDAEHFFDGYKRNKNYALKVLKVAEEANCDCIVLCDTNGGCLPTEVSKIVKDVKNKINTKLGIHAHNDTNCAVANTVVACEAGVIQLQGTINGYGERCGNADLCSVIPNVKLKLNKDCIPDSALENLHQLSIYVSELANISPNPHSPYVGASAFAHKGGMHVQAVISHPESFEHIKPEVVGNRRRVLVSELSGRSNIVYKAAEYNIDLTKDEEATKKILERLKELENKGYQYESAEASFELLIRKMLGGYKKLFDLIGFRLIIEKEKDTGTIAEATIKLKVKDKEEHVVAEGDGPVNALDNALRKALNRFYPQLKNIRLTDFKVRVIDEGKGTASKVRVLIESTDNIDTWSTVGVSENIIEASWEALVDSIEFGLQHTRQEK